MSKKKTYTPKVQGYVPQAVDGDDDGMVQDGTEFERPVGTEIDDFVEVTIEDVVITTPGTYQVQEGENIQTVASKFLPEGMSRNEYAQKLFKLNGQIRTGQVVRLG